MADAKGSDRSDLSDSAAKVAASLMRPKEMLLTLSEKARHSSSAEKTQRLRVTKAMSHHTETAWDLGTFAAVFAPGRTSPRATKHKETTWD